MHVFFSGIGGAGHSGLAMIARQAGYAVSGSDIKDSSYIDYLRRHGVEDIHIGQTAESIAKVHAQKPIDWFVYTSALPAGHPEIEFCRQNNIKTSKRDDFLNQILAAKKLQLIALAGTHGKSTSTAMAVWLFKELGVPVSYLLGAKIAFGEMAVLDQASQYFVYECDEFDRNFLSFYPAVSLITGLDWDHPDIYPTREAYYEAFREFIDQSDQTVLWHDDAEKLGLDSAENLMIIDEKDPQIDQKLGLAGHVNRLDAWLVAKALQPVLYKPFEELLAKFTDWPGISRRFERIAPNIYSDYAHTPPKIRGALQLAQEVAGDNVVVVYEGLHNTRQHFIKDELASLFDSVKQLYVVPSYLAREDPNLELLTPEKILDLLSISAKQRAEAAQLDSALAGKIKRHAEQGDLVLCLSAGGTGSLDEWLRHDLRSS